MANQPAQSTLHEELVANRAKQSEIEADLDLAIRALGRHVTNLGLNAGFVELTGLIKRAATLRSNLGDVEEEIAWLDEVGREYQHHRADLERTEREAQALYGRLEGDITALGEQGLARLRDEATPEGLRDRLRGFHADASPAEPPEADDDADSPGDARDQLQARTGVKRASEPTRLGWRLLRANSDLSWCTDPELRREIEELKSAVLRLLELERHQRFRSQGLREFDVELAEVWGFETVAAMKDDLHEQRDRMREIADQLEVEIGEIFNTHRLHDRVDDSFVAASRIRIKRYHVRINELKLRRRTILLELTHGVDDGGE